MASPVQPDPHAFEEAMGVPIENPDQARDALPAPKQNWRVTLAYDGTDFRGWQVQPGEPTVQGELQAALGRVTGETPLPQGSGRTDAGVHALAQVASFALAARIPADNLLRAVNRTLPPSIRLLEAAPAPPAFHARHSARAKTYEYRIFLERPDRSRNAVECSPFLTRYVWSCPFQLDLDALAESACQFLGEHDFSSFAATDPDLVTRTRIADAPPDLAVKPFREPDSPIRTVLSSAWELSPSQEGSLIVYRVQGNGFLHHMVRNLVGSMVDIGRGYRRVNEVPAMLAARNRSAAGPTAPAKGLFLHSVEYDELEAR